MGVIMDAAREGSGPDDADPPTANDDESRPTGDGFDSPFSMNYATEAYNLDTETAESGMSVVLLLAKLI